MVAASSVKDMFKENCGIALATQDPVAVAKAVSEFAKTSKLFTVRHASLEGKVLSATQVEALAKLPGKQELLGQVLGTMNAVPTNFVSLFANMVRPLICIQGDRREKGCLGNPLNTQAKVSKEQSHGRYQRRSR